MSERYWISGVQLGILKVINDEKTRQILVDEIVDKQFINNYVLDKNKKDFVKRLKELKE